MLAPRAAWQHEFVHALGFAEDSWPFFRNADGTPMTPRESDGLPALVSATCYDGSTRANVMAVSTDTLEVASERGTTVTRIVTPRVRSVVRDIFGCDSLRGAEIENQPTSATSDTCHGSHWDQRLFMNEFMAPVASHGPIYSPLTFALLEDSGWYKAHYNMSYPLIWGRGQGCSFVTQKCVEPSTGAPLEGYCNSLNVPSGAAEGCTPDGTARGYCDLRTHSSDLPAAYQYFPSNARLGGSMQTADYCPHYKAYSNGHCAVAANAPSTNYRAESYGATSKCFQVSMTQRLSSSSLTGSSTACYPTRCVDGRLEVQLNLDGGSTQWLQCSGPHVEVVPPSGIGIVSGNLTCPSNAAVLCDPNACTGMACEGSEWCHAGVCACGTGFDDTCISPPRSPPAPPRVPPEPPAPPSHPGPEAPIPSPSPPSMLLSTTVIMVVALVGLLVLILLCAGLSYYCCGRSRTRPARAPRPGVARPYGVQVQTGKA